MPVVNRELQHRGHYGVNMETPCHKGIWADAILLSKCSEVLDLMLIAYRVAEDERVITPAMVCLDGFFLSHSMQK